MTDEQVEKAARKLCELRGWEPDIEWIAWREHRKLGGSSHAEVAAVDIRDHLAIDAAIAHAREAEPAPSPDLAALGIEVGPNEGRTHYRIRRGKGWAWITIFHDDDLDDYRACIDDAERRAKEAR